MNLLRVVMLLSVLAAGPASVAAQPDPSTDAGIPDPDVVRPVIGTPGNPEAEAVPDEVVEALPAEPVPASAEGVAEAGTQTATGTAPVPGTADRVVSGIRGDVTGGGWLASALIYGTASTITRTSRGEEPDDAARHALQDLTKPEFFVGSLIAGSAGAALGTALPVPAAFHKAPLFLRALGATAAPLLLASAFSTVTTAAIQLHRQKKLTFRNLVRSIDWNAFGIQTAGSLIGMTLGATLVARKLAPAWSLGAVAVVPVAAGILGAIGGSQLLSWIRSRRLKTEDGANASTGSPTTAPDTPTTGRSGTGAGTSNPRAPGPVPDAALVVDPMVDIHIADPPVRAR